MKVWKSQWVLYNRSTNYWYIDIFSLRYAFHFEMNIYDVYNRNIKGEGTRKTIKFSTT